MGSMVLWVGWSHQSSDATFDRTRNGRLRKLAPKNLSKKAKMSHRIKPRMCGDEEEHDEDEKLLTLAAVIPVKSRMALTLAKDTSSVSMAPVHTTLR